MVAIRAGLCILRRFEGGWVEGGAWRGTAAALCKGTTLVALVLSAAHLPPHTYELPILPSTIYTYIFKYLVVI